jgi:predicted signal transduction protein with EAL and GGDEF domain
LGKDDRARRIVDASLVLARSLDMQVVAEGVEHAEQVNWLLARGCRMMQGYYFSRPIPAAELAERWLATEMRATSLRMSATAEETSAQGTTVAAAAEQAPANVQTAATATKELSSSVSEIGRQVTESTRIGG